MTPERAQYILDKRLEYGGLKYAFVLTNGSGQMIGSQTIYEDGITREEYSAIIQRWKRMPGHTCFFDALCRIARGDV